MDRTPPADVAVRVASREGPQVALRCRVERAALEPHQGSGGAHLPAEPVVERQKPQLATRHAGTLAQNSDTPPLVRSELTHAAEIRARRYHGRMRQPGPRGPGPRPRAPRGRGPRGVEGPGPPGAPRAAGPQGLRAPGPAPDGNPREAQFTDLDSCRSIVAGSLHIISGSRNSTHECHKIPGSSKEQAVNHIVVSCVCFADRAFPVVS